MFSLISYLLVFVLYFVATIVVIRIDAKRQREAALARGGVDFIDRRVTPYMLLSFISGAMPLIFYFGISRRSAAGWLLGIAMFFGVSFGAGLVGTILVRG